MTNQTGPPPPRRGRRKPPRRQPRDRKVAVPVVLREILKDGFGDNFIVRPPSDGGQEETQQP
jgi:hypothetical protein